MKIPTQLLQTRWPPNPGLMPGDERFDSIFEDVRANGIREPIVMDMKWCVIDGHHRLEIARLLNIEYVEVKVWTGREFVQ
jgi:ParB-like chromosome segregation protein Spo0J